MAAGIINPNSSAGAVQPCAQATSKPCQGQGMSADSQVNAFASGMAALKKDWPKLKPAQRRQRLQALASAQAKSNGFPPPKLVKLTEKELKDDPQKNGVFNYKDWQIKVNPNLLQHKELSDKQAAALGDTIYHETRHAEQWHLIARRRAAVEGKESNILKQFPPPVAKQATSQPLEASDSRRPCAEKLYTSVWGGRRAISQHDAPESWLTRNCISKRKTSI